MLCISYIPIDSIITYLHSLCPKFLIGSKPKRQNTSTGAVSFAMIWLSHPCILKINFWYKMACTLTLIMICGLNVLNVSIPTMLSAFKNQISTPTMSTFVPLCHVKTRFTFVSLLFILFWFFMFRMVWCGKKPPPKTLKQENMENWNRERQSHRGERLNTWSEADMAAAIQEYHE